jgi:hypothetical protein
VEWTIGAVPVSTGAFEFDARETLRKVDSGIDVFHLFYVFESRHNRLWYIDSNGFILLLCQRHYQTFRSEKILLCTETLSRIS